MKQIVPYIIIALGGSLLFMHSLGSTPLFDWDEINFAESAREMIVSGDYLRVQINFQPFWEKPPLFFWMQVLSMKMFGINEFAARFPNAICGIVTLMVLYSIGKKLHSKNFAGWLVLIYVSSFLPHVYFKSGIIDPWFNLFIFLGIFYLSEFLSNHTSTNNYKSLFISGLFTGLAILTKGPVGLMIVVLTYLVYILLNKGKGWLKIKYYLLWGSMVASFALIWFGLEIYKHGWWFVNEFFTYQIRLAKTEDAGHGGFPFYHFVVLMLGCFPASILMLNFKKTEAESPNTRIFKQMMFSSLIVILVVFSLVKTKIIHYSSFAYFPIVYLAVNSIDQYLLGKMKWKRYQQVMLLSITGIWAIVFVIAPFLFMHLEWLKPLFSADLFAMANLNASVNWNYIYLFPGILFLVGLIIGAVFIYRNKFRLGLIVICIACILLIQSILTFFVPNIEQYTQHAAIEFFKSLKEKDVYVKPLGYKSYAPYFYAEVKPYSNKNAYNDDWMIHGKIDKPVYLVTRIDRKQEVLEKYGSKLIILYEKNGFVFMTKKDH